MVRVLIFLFIALSLGGCSNIPIKDGELAIGKDTTAGIEDVGVACVNRKF